MARHAASILFVMASLSGCTGLFFQPMTEHVSDPATFGFAYEDVSFKAADGTALHGWMFETKREPVGALLLVHGNAENISTHFASAVWMVEEGFDVFVFDYRGYGRSAGSPDLDGLHLDAAAALDVLIDRPDIEPGKIVVFGQSLGGAIALETLAAHPQKDRLGALVVEGAFSGYRDIAREKLGSLWLTWPFQWPLGLTIDDSYSPKAAAGDIAPLPFLIIHGQADEVIPPHHGETLFEAAAMPKTIWRPAKAKHIQALATLSMRERFSTFLSGLLADQEALDPVDG